MHEAVGICSKPHSLPGRQDGAGQELEERAELFGGKSRGLVRPGIMASTASPRLARQNAQTQA